MKPLTVSEVATQIKELVRNHEPFNNASIIGEITDFRGAKKHLYFSIKDESAVLRCVMWQNRVEKCSDLKLENGMKVVLTGDIATYPGGSIYQLNVHEIQVMGTGDLYKQFVELKKKLQVEGLFDPAIKRPIPPFVRKVGIISSIKSAGLKDMLKVFSDGPPIEIILFDATVQGDRASQEIINGINTLDGKVELIIFGRGGGSMEDLWCFNDEELAYAVFACTTPTISAVGHEIDQVITDLVADHSASTPTAAAEFVVNKMCEVIDEFEDLKRQLEVTTVDKLRNARQTLDLCDIEAIGRNIQQRLGKHKEELARQNDRLIYRSGQKLMIERRNLSDTITELRSSRAGGIVEKGLAAVSQDGVRITEAKRLKPGKFEAEFRDGKAKGEVIEVEVRGSD